MVVKPKAKKSDLEFPIPFVTRKTAVTLLIRVVLTIFLLEALYIVLRLLGPDLGIDVGSLWIFLAVLLVQLGVVLLLAFRWYFETFEVHRNDVVHRRGIMFRHEEVYPYNNIQSITCDQSPVGRIYHYGEVRLFIPTLGRDLVFGEIPHPHHFIRTIKHILPYPDKQKFILHG